MAPRQGDRDRPAPLLPWATPRHGQFLRASKSRIVVAGRWSLVVGYLSELQPARKDEEGTRRIGQGPKATPWTATGVESGRPFLRVCRSGWGATVLALPMTPGDVWARLDETIEGREDAPGSGGCVQARGHETDDLRTSSPYGGRGCRDLPGGRGGSAVRLPRAGLRTRTATGTLRSCRARTPPQSKTRADSSGIWSASMRSWRRRITKALRPGNPGVERKCTCSPRCALS